MEPREASGMAHTIHPNCSKIALGGEKGYRDTEPQAEANLAGALFAQQAGAQSWGFPASWGPSNEGLIQARQQKETGSRIPREGRSGTSPEHAHAQTLCSGRPASPKPARTLFLLLSPTRSVPALPGGSLSLPCTSQAKQAVTSLVDMAIVW